MNALNTISQYATAAYTNAANLASSAKAQVADYAGFAYTKGSELLGNVADAASKASAPALNAMKNINPSAAFETLKGADLKTKVAVGAVALATTAAIAFAASKALSGKTKTA